MASRSATGLAYQLDDKVPFPLLAGTGIQHAALSLGSMILMPTAAFRAAGASEAELVWAVFASLVISGGIIALHARPIGRIGSGYVLAVGPSSAALALTVDALSLGGVALLSALAVTASVVQFALAFRMSLLRRLFTPTVSGTALMLIPVTVMPVVFDMLDAAPDDHAAWAGPTAAGVTILVVGGILLRGTPAVRAWAPVYGIVVGSLVGAFYGLYDTDRVARAAWYGVPLRWPPHLESGFAGFDFRAYAGLMPAFVLLFLVCAVRSMSSSLATQAVSWRDRRAPDFRPVQGTVAADALANLAAGLAGSMPNGANSSSVPRTQLSGVAARPVGLVYGAAVVVLAFSPKAVALVLAVPAPVFAGYLAVMIASTFTIGLKMAVSEGADHRQGLCVGLAFWIGAGCQYGFIFPDFVASFAGGVLNNALTSGGAVALLLTGLLSLTAGRRRRLETRLAVSALPDLVGFLKATATRENWGTAMAERLEAVGEEALLTLLRDDQVRDGRERRLLVVAHREGQAVVLELIAAAGKENIEDRLAVVGEAATEESVERDVSLRLLRHLATDVRHRQYHDVDILTVRVAEAG